MLYRFFFSYQTDDRYRMKDVPGTLCPPPVFLSALFFNSLEVCRTNIYRAHTRARNANSPADCEQQFAVAAGGNLSNANCLAEAESADRFALCTRRRHKFRNRRRFLFVVVVCLQSSGSTDGALRSNGKREERGGGASAVCVFSLPASSVLFLYLDEARFFFFPPLVESPLSRAIGARGPCVDTRESGNGHCVTRDIDW